MADNFLSNIKNVKVLMQSLPEQVAEQINQLIIDRHMEIGEKIPNELELAQQLNVGRGTVREAIKLLVARNVLEIRRGRGTFIAGNTGLIADPLGFAYMEDKNRLLRELMDVRMQMEPWVAELAAEKATEENIAELWRIQKEVDDLIHEGKNHLQKDQQLHTSIANCTQNRVLPLLIPIITYSVQLFGTMSQLTLTRETMETHAQVLDAIEKHDARAAHDAMVEHLRVNELFLADMGLIDIKK